jgi:hypothetical protein
MRAVFLFSGQGSKQVGMLQRFRLDNQSVSGVFLKTRQQIQLDPAAPDAEEKLRSTVFLQICLPMVIFADTFLPLFRKGFGYFRNKINFKGCFLL